MENKFKVGDKVKIIDDSLFHPDLRNGDIGKVVSLNWNNRPAVVVVFNKEGQTYRQVVCSDADLYIKKID